MAVNTPAGAAFDGVPGVSDPAAVTAPTVGRALDYDRAYTYDTVGRLTRVEDRTQTVTGATETPDTPASTTAPCAVRAYGFDRNGRRTSLASTTHADGDCASAGYPTTTTSYGYDDADRPTTGGNGTGAYADDARRKSPELLFEIPHSGRSPR